MPVNNQTCYAFIQLPDTFEWTVCGLLTVKEVAPNAYQGVFQYGRSYLARQNAPSLDPYNLPLTDRPKAFTKLKGIPGALRDASPDAWGRRVIQAKLSLPEADLSEIDYLRTDNKRQHKSDSVSDGGLGIQLIHGCRCARYLSIQSLKCAGIHQGHGYTSRHQYTNIGWINLELDD